MLQNALQIIKWISIPALLFGSVFSRFAGTQEFLLNAVICLGAILVLPRAVWTREYFWAGGLVAIAIVFSPILLVAKIFLLMTVASIATCATLFAMLTAWKAQPAPVV